MNIDGGTEPGLVDAHGLDLKPNHAPGVEVERGELRGLAVWKRAKEV
jgi:hypothetical protein